MFSIRFFAGLLVAWCVMISGHAIPQAVADTPVSARFEKRVHRLDDGTEYPWMLMSPADLDVNKKYPLVLFLHGAGERGNDLTKALKHFPEVLANAENRSKFPCFLIVPQCPNGQQWVDVPWGDKTSQPLAKKPGQPLQRVMTVLQHAIEHLPVDADRVYLTGLSMGGYGSWELAMRMPNTFAAVAPICGGGDETQAALLKDVPLWVAHGDADTAVPVERSRVMVAAVRKAGGNVVYNEYPRVGHNSWNRAYRNADGAIPWMFQQVRKPAKKLQ